MEVRLKILDAGTISCAKILDTAHQKGGLKSRTMHELSVSTLSPIFLATRLAYESRFRAADSAV